MEEREGEVLAYFPAPLELPFGGVWEEWPDEDWLSAWRRDLGPVRAGPFLVLAPWHEVGEGIPLWIEPGMAFGTGHHETTRLALRALARYAKRGGKALDLGTGSGILAIAAALLGMEALGVDIDPSVLPIARENARRNGVAPLFLEGSLEAARPFGPFGLLLANLYAELHEAFAPAYREVLGEGGVALLTGILEAKAQGVEGALLGAGFRILEREEEGGWVLYAATPGL